MAPPPTDKSLWRAWPYIVVWMILSISLIFMNNDILHKIEKPALLTAWHMAISSVLVQILRCAAPPSLGLFSEERPEVSLNTWLTKLLPIAALFSTSLAMGNRAYIYCSIAFIQMVKASHSVMTYLLNTLVGAELFMWSKLQSVTLVCFGVMLAVAGELHFHMVGFLCQCLSSVSECTRVVLIGQLLNKSGLKMDPLTAISYYAPLCFACLVPFAFVTEVPCDWGSFAEGLLRGGTFAFRCDWGSFAEDFQLEIGLGWLILNGLVAFALNVSAVLLISATSPVVYILCGIIKDVSIISGSVVVLHQLVQFQQIVGYAIAVAGIQMFNLVSRNTDVFESQGLVRGSWEVASQWWGPGHAERDTSETDEKSEFLASSSTRESPAPGEGAAKPP